MLDKNDIARIKKENIMPNGYYFGLDDGFGNFMLTDEQIRIARLYFRDPNIASKRNIEKNKVSRKKCKIDRNSKYNGKRCRHKKGEGRKLIRTISGVVIAVTLFSSISLILEDGPLPKDMSYEQQGYHSQVTRKGSLDIIEEIDLLGEESIEMKQRKEWIKQYCNIYQVNYDVVYQALIDLTNSFQSPEYQQGIIKGVTCKGENVVAFSEEELLLYFVRCIKQLPEQLNISKDNLYVTNSYQPQNNYSKSIGYYSNILNVDPCLIYSIIQAETGWNSELFQNKNNPAGLKNGNEWWSFDTKEEGFIELMLEIKKYNRMGASTISEIGKIHAPKSDNNDNWVPMVTEIYQTVSAKSDDLFGSFDNNGKHY